MLSCCLILLYFVYRSGWLLAKGSCQECRVCLVLHLLPLWRVRTLLPLFSEASGLGVMLVNCSYLEVGCPTNK